MKLVKARYVLGLTATPIRRDGQQPIIFMQCGPIRHTASKPKDAPRLLEVFPRLLPSPIEIPEEAGIQDVFRALTNDQTRTKSIVEDIIEAYHAGRSMLVLTERTDHLESIETTLEDSIKHLFILHGRLSRRQRTGVVRSLEELPDDAPRVLLATGRSVGEGFDHPPLDTLMLSMPISWKGTLQQYAGRLHRAHVLKLNIQIYDYIDQNHPSLMRMWGKRQRGYKSMGYQIRDPA